jgi:hypothetical protein
MSSTQDFDVNTPKIGLRKKKAGFLLGALATLRRAYENNSIRLSVRTHELLVKR